MKMTMEKTIASVNMIQSGRSMSVAESVVECVKAGLQAVTDVFSAVFEEEITIRQMLCIMHAALALLVAVFGFGMSFAAHIGAVVWLAVALWMCKKSGLKGEEPNEEATE